jgi:integrase
MREVKQIWEAAELLGYPFGPYLRSLILTGQRRTEVASMKWSDINLELAIWILKASTTKSARTHLVPLSAPMMSLLTELPRIGEGGFVFTTDGETHINGFSKGKARIDAYLAGRGDQLEPWRLHDIRRTVGTHMARIGIMREVRARVFNHAMQGVTDRVYNVFDYQSEKRIALDRWAAELMRAINTPTKAVHRPAEPSSEGSSIFSLGKAGHWSRSTH